ncbi:MAG: hypothetical protein NC299_01290 [Lachnospiraceae bacterium]|nr:hypothetical protein [Ruminococcus sp.]MCM1273983.1 hypothetical protein [Lachnospiraceae bacterium]
MKIEFVSFTGEYPCLCFGTLTLRINGRETTFGCFRESAEYKDFWKSGGTLYLNYNDDGEYYVTEGDWTVREDELPDFLKPHAAELAEIMNRNVPRGHCGGCL